MNDLLIRIAIGVGGFTGAIARYALGSYIGGRYGVRFPYGTFVINMTGSFLIGFILALLSRTTASPCWRYLNPIGFIGAYTTFSTFESETPRAIQGGQVTVGVLNVVLSVVIGFVAVWAGATMGRVFA